MLCVNIKHNLGWKIAFLSILVVLSAVGYCQLMLEMRVAFAREQVHEFEIARKRADTGDVREATQCLRFVMTYYPSGSKQVASSVLDEIVETSRAQVAQCIIAALRRKSGKDFGMDPQAWIRAEKEAEKGPLLINGDHSPINQ